MKTLADFKRRIKPGVKLHTIFHSMSGDIDKGIRPVTIVRTQNFALKTEQPDKIIDSWVNFPKANDFKIVDCNTIQMMVLNPRTNHLQPILTYKFIEA